ncbi:uncharacterized protein [Littorina saxatilis]|uniref:SWIM-type domain-containing protein n=1 Tax=Littorina saxatilis TaxID=31220 RepID=A0AAN9ASC7_9CAEN
MEKSKEKDTRSCLERLLPAGKQRYKEKLLDIQGNDPYKIPAKSWSTDPENFPDIESVGIFSYFVLNVSYYTSEQFRAYRSLAAYKTFVAGWVRDIKTYKPGGCENIVVTAKVLHSQKLNEASLTPWLIASADGSKIESAHCTCTAGVGETCSHVGALAFALESFTQARERTTCTGVSNCWKVPQGIKGVLPTPTYNIDFTSAKSKKTRLQQFIADDTAVRTIDHTQKAVKQTTPPTAEELSGLFQKLQTNCEKQNLKAPSCVKVSPEFCKMYRCLIPASLCTLRDSKCVGMALGELQEHCRSLSDPLLSISAEETAVPERATRDQAKSAVWFAGRVGRKTASKLYSACATNPTKPAVSLIQSICYPKQKMFKTEATEWGCQKEEKALTVYMQTT